MEDQAEAVDLFAAFHIDLAQPFHHHRWQVTTPQQGSDQGADCGKGVRTSWVSASSSDRSAWRIGFWFEELVGFEA